MKKTDINRTVFLLGENTYAVPLQVLRVSTDD